MAFILPFGMEDKPTRPSSSLRWEWTWKGPKTSWRGAPVPRKTKMVELSFTGPAPTGATQMDLIVTDGHEGLLSAVSALFPATPRQRCLVHKLRNVLALHGWWPPGQG